jgi:protein SCO1/2
MPTSPSLPSLPNTIELSIVVLLAFLMACLIVYLMVCLIVYPRVWYSPFSHNTTQAHNQPTDNASLPSIQGIVLANAYQLNNFWLRNQDNQLFNTKSLRGKWHFISYGYTQCPDICPTTLMTLTRLIERLKMKQLAENTSFIFYSIDPDRDSQVILSNYISYFDQQFIALFADKHQDKTLFESALGIKAIIKKGNDTYQVSHDLQIFLTNPDGDLQAVFIPQQTELGVNQLTTKQLFDGYLKVKRYYQARLKVQSTVDL